jgi:hypothetical protein
VVVVTPAPAVMTVKRAGLVAAIAAHKLSDVENALAEIVPSAMSYAVQLLAKLMMSFRLRDPGSRRSASPE